MFGPGNKPLSSTISPTILVSIIPKTQREVACQVDLDTEQVSAAGVARDILRIVSLILPVPFEDRTGKHPVLLRHSPRPGGRLIELISHISLVEHLWDAILGRGRWHELNHTSLRRVTV